MISVWATFFKNQKCIVMNLKEKKRQEMNEIETMNEWMEKIMEVDERSEWSK